MAEGTGLQPFEIEPPMAEGGIWVFAYGSLMWKPGFPHTAVHPALLRGFHRSLCVYSVRYRGTVETPGLVMGLDRGGACLGRAYRVTRTDWASVCAYLHDREMVTNTYMPKFLKVRLDDGREVPAYTFIVRRDHRQYTGKLSEERIVELVLQGAGWEGTSTEYLANTVAHMDDLGIPEGPLHKILERVQAG